MGCALSSNPKPGDVKVEQLRRRLTVSNLDEMGGGGEDAEPTNEHERGLLHKVTEKSTCQYESLSRRVVGKNDISFQ